MSPTRLLHILTLVALLFAPFEMIGTHAAAAAPGAQATDHAPEMASHCAEPEQAPAAPDRPDIDCAIACSMVPAREYRIEARAAAPLAVASWPLASGLSGLHPESETPPPRFV